MILTDNEIRESIDNGLLVFNNEVEKKNIYEKINPDSLDVTLSSMHKRPIINTVPLVYGKYFDEKKYWRDYNEKNIEIKPGQMILACTNEYFVFPSDMCGELSLKSSMGRLFIDLLGDTTIDAGFEGCLSIKLQNNGLHTIVIPANSRIAKLRLYKLKHTPEQTYLDRESRYQKASVAETMKPEDLGKSQNAVIEGQQYIIVREKMIDTLAQLDRKYWNSTVKNPCPKCGQYKTVNYSRFDEPDEDDKIRLCYEISCSGCGFSFHRKHSRLKEALEDWNDSCPSGD